MTKLVLALATLALLPATASAKPQICDADVIQQALIDAGKLTAEDVGFGMVVDLVRCGDVTADGDTDAVFTVASGGTAGDTHFGVLRGQRGRLARRARALPRRLQGRHRAAQPPLVRGAPAALREERRQLLPELVPAAALHVDRQPLQGRPGQEAQDRAAALLPRLAHAAGRRSAQ